MTRSQVDRSAAARWRRVLRVPALGFVAAALGLPVGQVHSVVFPKIQKLSIVGNDLKTVRGVGAPGQKVLLSVRQRNFREDDGSPLDLGCPGNSESWVQYGDLDEVDEKGKFVFDGLDLMVMPSGTGFQDCDGALFTEFFVAFGPAPDDVLPQVHMFNIPNFLADHPEKWVEADVEGADEVAAMVTDGPNDTDDALGGVDIDEDGIDLCDVPGFGCGRRVSYQGSGGTFASPSIFEHDGSTFGLPPKVDDEFPFVLAMLEAHAPGGSVLAAAKVPRHDPPTGGELNVNVNVRARLGIDCGGGFFDFPL